MRYATLLLGVAAAAVAGCSGPKEDPTPDTPSDTTVSDSGGLTRPDPSPALSTEDLVEQIEGIFRQGVPQPFLLRDTYLSLMRAGDADCPGADATDIVNPPVPLSGCESSTGYFYAGAATYLEKDDMVETEEGTWVGLLGMEMPLADFQIVTPEGDTFGVGGTFSYTGTRSSMGEETWIGRLKGSWIYPPAGGWLGAGVSMVFTYEGSANATDGSSTTLDGGLTIGGRTIEFEDFIFPPGACMDAPYGVIYVRQDDGYRYRIEFPDDCSGCGTAVFNDDEEVGQVCLSLPGVNRFMASSMGVPCCGG